MLPRSDDLEAFVARGKELTTQLKRVGNAEVNRAELKQALAAFAREWLRYSQALRHAGVGDEARLEACDRAMQELLESTSNRARATALRKKLEPVLEGAFNDVIVPLIKFEGSPRQVAARQLLRGFGAALDPEEVAYLEEASRCLTVQCLRAAIIMLWAAGVARLHGAVNDRGFAAYNAAVDAIVAKKGAPFNRIKEGAKVASVPELQRSRDADLLIVGMELFGYDLQVYQQLDRMLSIRNDAAHPGAAQPTTLDVQQFATNLNDYLFSRVTR